MLQENEDTTIAKRRMLNAAKENRLVAYNSTRMKING
jgi:hypothetical protein